MKRPPERLPIESKEIIETKLHQKREEFLLKGGFSERNNSSSSYKAKKTLSSPEVIEQLTDDFKGLRKSFDWLELTKNELIPFKKDGLLEDSNRFSKKGRRVIIQIIDEFIQSEIKLKKSDADC